MRFIVITSILISLILFTLILGGCSNNILIKKKQSDKYSTQETNQTIWLQHKKELSQINKWQFNGRFGAKTDTENWNGSINWVQNDLQYKINISGPLSSGSILLQGTENFSQLKLSDDTPFIDTDPQQLLQNHTGLKLPVNELRYWLLGLPDPQSKYDTVEINENGQLSRLTQNNWEVSFKRYIPINKLQLPDKIFLVNHEINVRLIIQKWQILS